MKLLSICIPTYNRSLLAIEQLEFIKSELNGFEHLIDIFVSDNNSSITDIESLNDYHKTNPFFNLIIQKTNHGLIGNVYKLLENINSKYVWFVGDDDVLLKNIINNLIKILSNNEELYLVFFNHQGFIDTPENKVTSFNTLGFEGCINDGKQCLIKLFNVNFTALMFITSCVFRVEILKNNFQNKNRIKLIEDPLLFSFVSSSLGKIYIVKDVFVLDRYANASWKNNSSKIFGWGVSNAILNLADYNFSKKEISKLLCVYYNNFLGSYIRMLILSPFLLKCRIIFYLKSENLILLARSFKYLYKRYKI